MAYSKVNFKDHIVEFPDRIKLQDNGDGTYTIIWDEGNVIQTGTVLGEGTFGQMDEGIAQAHNDIQEHKNSQDPHTQYTLDSDMNSHVGAGGSAHANATTFIAGFMSGADKSKLNGIETGATADQTASEILTSLKTVDGNGSGLDADTVDGKHASNFLLTTGKASDSDKLDGQHGSYFLDYNNFTNKPITVSKQYATGQYTGNGNTTTGQKITLGFKPDMVAIVHNVNGDESWHVLYDNFGWYFSGYNDGYIYFNNFPAVYSPDSTGFIVKDRSGWLADDLNDTHYTYTYHAYKFA